MRPNFNNPPSLHPHIIAVGIVTSLLATAFVALRIYTRAFITRALWWDDYTAVAGLALSIAVFGVTVACQDQSPRNLGCSMYADGLISSNQSWSRRASV